MQYKTATIDDLEHVLAFKEKITGRKANRLFMLRALQEGIIAYIEENDEICAIAYGFRYNREVIELANIIPLTSPLIRQLYTFFTSQASIRGWNSVHIDDSLGKYL